MPKDEAAPIVKELYKTFSAPRNLMIQRAEALWAIRLHDPSDVPHRYGVYFRDGEPRGYVQFLLAREVFTTSRGQQITVNDLVALDNDAWRGLWEFFGVHDLVGKVQWGSVPEDDPAPVLLAEPRVLNRRTSDALYMRITDVANALPQRPYAEPGRLVLRVLDELCDWNDGTFELETSGGDSSCRPSHDEPDITLPVRALAVLASGHRSATALARAGLLQAVDEKVLAQADRIFATAYAPYCSDGF